MSRSTRAHFVPSIFGFAIAAMALWSGLGQSLVAYDAAAQVDASKSDMPTTPVKSVPDSRPPISCKVAAKGVLIDCHINNGYDLNDVANWFQHEHDQTLQLAVNSVTLAKKFERSFESCVDKKENHARNRSTHDGRARSDTPGQ